MLGHVVVGANAEDPSPAAGAKRDERDERDASGHRPRPERHAETGRACARARARVRHRNAAASTTARPISAAAVVARPGSRIPTAARNSSTASPVRGGSARRREQPAGAPDRGAAQARAHEHDARCCNDPRHRRDTSMLRSCQRRLVQRRITAVLAARAVALAARAVALAACALLLAVPAASAGVANAGIAGAPSSNPLAGLPWGNYSGPLTRCFRRTVSRGARTAGCSDSSRGDRGCGGSGRGTRIGSPAARPAHTSRTSPAGAMTCSPRWLCSASTHGRARRAYGCRPPASRRATGAGSMPSRPGSARPEWR